MQQRSNRYSRWLVTALGGALVLGSAACDKKDFNIVGLLASSITVSPASNGQVGVAGQPLAQPIVVHVADQDGASAVNALVTWTVVGSGGSVSSATSTTDVNGNASVTWTLGQTVGTDSLIASIVSGASVTITATVTNGAATTITKTSGDGQSIAAGTTSAPLVIQLVDQFGNPVANTTVNWAVTAGTGTLSSATATTDATGHAQVTYTTGAVPGTSTITVTSGAAAPTSFTVVGT